ncbi:MAG: hypothetical protein PVG78_17230 [Desulfobacterales bacterium]|jgi:hypothetical protein
MSKLTIFSLILIAVGLLLVGFQAIQSLMGMEIVWKEITLKGLLYPEHVQWFESLSWAMLRKAAIFVLSAPLYAVLLVTGGVLLIGSGLFGKVR